MTQKAMIKLVGGLRDGLTFEVSRDSFIVYVPYRKPVPIAWKEISEDLSSGFYQELQYQLTNFFDEYGRRICEYKDR